MNRSECPRCGNNRLLGWQELNDDEREVVKRLDCAEEYTSEERQSRHRWCTRCWYEETGGGERTA